MALAQPATLVAALTGDPLQLSNLCLHDAQTMLCAALSREPDTRRSACMPRTCRCAR